MVVMFQNIVNFKKKQQQQPAMNSLAKPETCPWELFVNESCPCIFTEPQVIICDRLGLATIPNTFLSSVYKIRMSNNSITDIDHVLWPRSLSSLVLIYNRITHISKSTFQLAPNLSKLYLSHNEISHIDNEAFSNLPYLTTLQIESNKLTTFNSQMLRQTPLLTKLHLSENLIDLPEQTSFGHCRNLKELLLDHNRISIIRAHWFSNMTSLIWLSLTHNQISTIEANSFDWNYELEELNLSFNRITVIKKEIFARGLNIQRLFLGGNPLKTLPSDAFREIARLKSLNLTHIDFDHIVRETFSYLKQLEFIYFAQFRYCHYATHVRVCRPLTDGLSSSQDLLAFSILKYAVWVVASVCTLGNIFVFIWRSVSAREDRTLSLLVRNLSIADLMMGVYLGAIGWQDWKFQHNFGRHAIEWMSSWQCTAIGFLAILSSELSVFILLIITIERYRCIMSFKRIDEATQERRARRFVANAWLLSFLLAFYPLVEWMVRKSDNYSTNGLCLPLHIDNPYTPGWQYSAFIYLGINFLAVMIIIALYVHMYAVIMDTKQAAARPVLFKAEKREDAILAIRFFFIVVTDCLCWIPIVVIKVMALANVSISSSIYGWLVVFIIPINSALNPIIYTLAAPSSLSSAICRLFERFCYKVDLLAGGLSNHSSRSSGSSRSDQTAIPIFGNRRRTNTGSNSTTCENLEISISSNHRQKTSFESATLMNNFPPSNKANCSRNDVVSTEMNHDDITILSGSTYKAPSSPSQITLDNDTSIGYKCSKSKVNGGSAGGKTSCPQLQYHMTATTTTSTATSNPCEKGPQRTYDCVSICTDNETTITHKLIANQTSNHTNETPQRIQIDHNQRRRHQNRANNRRLNFYDMIKRKDLDVEFAKERNQCEGVNSFNLATKPPSDSVRPLLECCSEISTDAKTIRIGNLIDLAKHECTKPSAILVRSCCNDNEQGLDDIKYKGGQKRD